MFFVDPKTALFCNEKKGPVLLFRGLVGDATTRQLYGDYDNKP